MLNQVKNNSELLMKLCIKLLPVIMTIFITGSCSMNRNLSQSKAVISPLSDKTIIKNGSLIYALPLTVVDVIVETERVIKKPGPYARFAGDMLGLTDVILNESEYWSVRCITIKTHQELDPSEFYIIETGTIFQTNVLLLKKTGLILDLNPELYYSDDVRYQDKQVDLNQLQVLDLGADEYYQARSDTAYKLVNVDTAFIKVPYLVERKQKLTVDQLADKAARRLMEMRDGKHLILTGEANVFPQSDAAIKEMNRLEKEYTELFSGKTWTERKTFSFQIIPRKEMIGNPVTLFNFSEMTGPGATTEKNGTPVRIEFTPEMKTKDITLITKGKSDPAKQKNDKLFYRVPDVVNLKISIGNDILNNSRRLVYQFGEIVQLPANFILGL